MAQAKNFDALHLSSRADYQVQMTNWFEVQIQGISESLVMLGNNINLPERSNPVVELPFGNSKAKVAGQAEWADGSFTIMDAIMRDTELEVEQWQNQVYDPHTGKMGWVDQYKREMVVTQRGPDGTYLRSWRYVGVWPSNVTYGELTGESSDKKVITLTLSYDRAWREEVQNAVAHQKLNSTGTGYQAGSTSITDNGVQGLNPGQTSTNHNPFTIGNSFTTPKPQNSP